MTDKTTKARVDAGHTLFDEKKRRSLFRNGSGAYVVITGAKEKRDYAGMDFNKALKAYEK